MSQRNVYKQAVDNFLYTFVLPCVFVGKQKKKIFFVVPRAWHLQRFTQRYPRNEWRDRLNLERKGKKTRPQYD